MNAIRQSIIYFKMAVKTLGRQPSWRTLQGTVRFLPAWWQHLKPGRDSVTDKMPWIAFGAIDFIKKIVRPGMTVFEYGSGGSTLFWSANVSKVVSIEHDKNWYIKMKKELEEQEINNVDYILAEAEEDVYYNKKSASIPDGYISDDKGYTGKNFENYVKQIDRFPDNYFDIIVVDGRARPSCILHSLTKIKINGYLIVDNTERGYYLKPFSFDHSNWRIWNFSGPVPYNYHFSKTTIFQKKQVCN